jgi:hypothetical protein
MKPTYENHIIKIAISDKDEKATERACRSVLENRLESLEPNAKASDNPKHVQYGVQEGIGLRLQEWWKRRIRQVVQGSLKRILRITSRSSRRFMGRSVFFCSGYE